MKYERYRQTDRQTQNLIIKLLQVAAKNTFLKCPKILIQLSHFPFFSKINNPTNMKFSDDLSYTLIMNHVKFHPFLIDTFRESRKIPWQEQEQLTPSIEQEFRRS